MSSPLRVGFVAEGPTDFVVLEAVVGHLLAGRQYVPVSIQPLLSAAFGAASGGGWTEIFFWAQQAASQAGGSVRNDPLFQTFDILIVQIDADVAGKSYADDQRITNPPNDLPCVKPCPPASATTDALRTVLLNWMGEASVPPKTILCTPSKSLEAWVLVALFPQNQFAADPAIECRNNPEAQLSAQPLAHRLIRSGKKQIIKYRDNSGEIAEMWATVRERCSEAERFSVDFLSSVPAVP